MRMRPCDWVAIWYRCLVCQRCFQTPEKLIIHKNTKGCGKLYAKLSTGVLRKERRNSVETISSVSSSSSTKEQTNPIIKKEVFSPEDNVEDIECPLKPAALHPFPLPIPSSSPSRPQIQATHQHNKHNGKVFSKKRSNNNKHLQKCYFCKIKYKTFLGMSRHFLIHTGEKPFTCDSCGKGFHRKDYCDNHFHTKHHLHKRPQESEEKHLVKRLRSYRGHQCSLCDHRYSKLEDLQLHMVTHVKKEKVSV